MPRLDALRRLDLAAFIVILFCLLKLNWIPIYSLDTDSLHTPGRDSLVNLIDERNREQA